MSRVGSNPVVLPQGVECALGKGEVSVKGPKGSLRLALDGSVAVSEREGQLHFEKGNDSRHAGVMQGTVRALVNNMVSGVHAGFEKHLVLSGVGYRANLSGDKLSLSLNYSHDVEYVLPKGVSAKVVKQTEIILSGIDKQLLGQTAAEIRALRPPEPYKGKGVSYRGEVIRRKETKKKK